MAKAASWSSGSRAFVGEPISVPRNIYNEDAEDDDYIVFVEVRKQI
jgi:hypothetical protein